MDNPSGKVQTPAPTGRWSHQLSIRNRLLRRRWNPAGRRNPRLKAWTDESLFGNLLSGLRSRWDNVQASFVDDPKQCVQKADRLESDVVDRLTAGFEQARSRLEQQWARGDEASTEDLRQALKRYREFFHRLLSMDDTEPEHRGR